MKKLYLGLIILGVLIAGYFAWISATHFLYQRAEEICRVDVCEMDNRPEYQGYSYGYVDTGLCGCFKNHNSIKIKVVNPTTGRISEPTYSPIE